LWSFPVLSAFFFSNFAFCGRRLSLPPCRHFLLAVNSLVEYSAGFAFSSFRDTAPFCLAAPGIIPFSSSVVSNTRAKRFRYRTPPSQPADPLYPFSSVLPLLFHSLAGGTPPPLTNTAAASPRPFRDRLLPTRVFFEAPPPTPFSPPNCLPISLDGTTCRKAPLEIFPHPVPFCYRFPPFCSLDLFDRRRPLSRHVPLCIH